MKPLRIKTKTYAHKVWIVSYRSKTKIVCKAVFSNFNMLLSLYAKIREFVVIRTYSDWIISQKYT